MADIEVELLEIAPPLVVDVGTGVGLGIFDVLLYIAAFAGVVMFVVVLRKPIIYIHLQ